MTHAELVAIVEGIVPVMRDLVREAVAELPGLREKVAALETREPVDATVPIPRLKGDYEPGAAYTPGNIVRYKSALWTCGAATTLAPDAVSYDADGRPAGPQGKDAWTLLLRDGKRGRDGKDGGVGPQGKAGRDWQQVYDETRRR